MFGCRPEESITTYEVPPLGITEAQEPEESHRTLAAIVPRDDRVWFFKMTGPVSQLEGSTRRF